MKRANKVMLKISGILLGLGLIFVVVTGIIIVATGNYRYTALWYDEIESEDDSMASGQSIDLSNANIKNISLEGNYGKVQIIKGDRFSYEVVGTEVNSSMFTHEVSEDTWKIKVKNRSGFYFFGFGVDDHISLLKITVPSTEMLENVKIKLNAGSLNVERLAAKNLEMEMGAGSLEAEELIGEEKLKLTVSAGKCKVDNMIGKDPYIRCEAGQIKGKGILTGQGKVNCGVGQIDLEVLGNLEEYDYTVSCSVGAIKVNGSQVGGIATKNSKKLGAANNFALDCGVGQINVDFVPTAN